MRDDIYNPRRLCEAEEAPAGLRALLNKAKDDGPSALEVQQLVAAVEAQLAGAPTAQPPLGQKTIRSSAAKGLALLAVVGAGLSAWYLLREHTEPTTVASTPPGPAAPPPSLRALPAPASAAPAAELPSTDPTPARATPPQHKGGRLHDRERETIARSSASRQNEPQAEAARSGLGDGAAAERTRADEFSLLRAARQALANHAETALRLTDEHARRFPAGMLAQERETIAVEALVKLGRTAQAHSRARAFFAAHPESPYKNRIDAALARSPEQQQAP